MKATKPILHGRDHVPGGADPVPGLLPGITDYQTTILNHPCAKHYWPCDETDGDLLDRIGGWNLVRTTPHDVAGVSYPVYGGENGVGNARHVPGVSGDTGRFLYLIGTGDTPPYWGGAADRTIELWLYLAFTDGGFGGYPLVNGASTSDGFQFLVDSPTGCLRYQEAIAAAAVDPGVFPVGVWQHVAAVAQAGTVTLYRGGVPVATGGQGNASGGSLNLTNAYAAAHPWSGNVRDVAFYDCALTAAELQSHVLADGVTDTEGLVLGIDESGHPAWVPPTVEVSGGGLDDTTPDPTPVDTDSGPYAGTPTTGTGWHLEAHTEIVFLVDATRGRFDVPTMKWTRVPFNTIRILRTWEPTVDADVVKTAWLPDDRGLSGPAKDGVLHVNADMVWSGDQLVQGWVSIEYPVLDPFGLPDDDPEVPGYGPRPEAPGSGLAGRDSYMRALRPFNLSAGSPLHMPSSGDPAFLTWHFWDEAHVMEEGGYPPPTYPIWAARPLHLPPPYPQLSPTDSSGYYTDSVGDPGWRFDKLSVATTLSAGANLCLQAWQDSPWLIRFSTDRFPAYHGYTGTYRGYPYLYLSFAYDPDTIDHTTGKLLLPAPA